MRVALTAEQRAFGATLHDQLAAGGVPATARAWAAGNCEPGLALWRSLAGAGVTGLMVPESCGGASAGPADLVVACEELGHHPVPGPLAESLAAVPALLLDLAAGDGPAAGWLAGLAGGELIATVALPPSVPYALDAGPSGLVLSAAQDEIWLARPEDSLASADLARRLHRVSRTELVAGRAGPAITRAAAYGTLASAALLLGAGRGLLDAAVGHAKTREQFGRPIGSFQAVKHALADVLIGLEFARPLLHGAAAALDAGAATTARDIAAARVACADAANLAARTALQVHGAIGYTLECDVSLWLAKVRALSATWGSQAQHRATVLAALSHEDSGPWA
ncbi:MAG TPA: acyl-CoA dehydrogenase family protein [Streptosporangiaceae bacterium]